MRASHDQHCNDQNIYGVQLWLSSRLNLPAKASSTFKKKSFFEMCGLVDKTDTVLVGSARSRSSIRPNDGQSTVMLQRLLEGCISLNSPV